MAARVAAADDAAERAASRARTAAALHASAERVAASRTAALAPLLPALLRSAELPAPALLSAPVPPNEAVRGLLVLQALTARAGAEAAAAVAAAATARDAAAAAATDAAALEEARAAARAASAALDAALDAARRRREAEPPAPETVVARRAAEGAGRAGDLDGALRRLREARAVPAATPVTTRPPSDPARAQPVVGTVLRGFGAATEGGPAQGLTWQATPGARVLSPCAGRIAFAAPFRGYGRLLIVDCGDGYHFVLTGLDRLDVAAGADVLAGEPVGRLAGGEERRPTLYGELRRAGQPVDPRRWLAGAGN